MRRRGGGWWGGRISVNNMGQVNQQVMVKKNKNTELMGSVEER